MNQFPLGPEYTMEAISNFYQITTPATNKKNSDFVEMLY
jgi:hypothetical protein